MFRKGDPKTVAAAKKGVARRKRPYYHFRELKKSDPETLKYLQSRGGKNKTAL